ncbi:phenylalanine--tRNA ligase beta subunit-related protein [Micromonospora sp. NPDC005707]|uniref:B3/B4 domain-containing protein n=1 Tax=Micromonospora sp. NPDC005707 TaxID=3157050 RepID=UPI0033FBE753
MRFRHAPHVWSTFPELTCGVLHAAGITPGVDVTARLARYADTARARLAAGAEGGFPEIQAWRRAFARMGSPPTRYRCAAESLLRRFRRDGALPRLHPLVDLGNALSLGYAVPVAVLDLARIAGDLSVRPATGEETYLTLGGDEEHPEPGELIFADAAGRAHSRRWTHRQSGASAVRAETTEVLVVVEAMHDDGPAVVHRMLAELAAALAEEWGVRPRTAVLTAGAPDFVVSGRTGAAATGGR